MIDSENCNKLIERYNDLDGGDKVKFKRSCGKMLNEVDADTLMLFYKVTSGKTLEWEENRIFVALCIQSLWDCTEEERISLDQAIKQYVKSESQGTTASFNLRVIQLLDTEWDESGFMAEKITRMAKMLKQKGFALSGHNLMMDLLHWNDVSRSVQKKWARTISTN